MSRLSNPKVSTPDLCFFTSVISRTILTHKDVAESVDAPGMESRLVGPPGLKGAYGFTKTEPDVGQGGRQARPQRQGRAAQHADEM